MNSAFSSGLRAKACQLSSQCLAFGSANSLPSTPHFLQYSICIFVRHQVHKSYKKMVLKIPKCVTFAQKELQKRKLQLSHAWKITKSDAQIVLSEDSMSDKVRGGGWQMTSLTSICFFSRLSFVKEVPGIGHEILAKRS